MPRPPLGPGLRRDDELGDSPRGCEGTTGGVERPPACHSEPQVRNLRNPTTSTLRHEATGPLLGGMERFLAALGMTQRGRSELLKALWRPSMGMRTNGAHSSQDRGNAGKRVIFRGMTGRAAC